MVGETGKYLEQGNKNFENGNYVKSVDDYCKVLEDNPGCVEAWDKMRIICEEFHLLLHAGEIYLRIKEIDPEYNIAVDAYTIYRLSWKGTNHRHYN